MSWVLGYMRWTQLTPMVLLWGFGLVMVLALAFVNFQEQAVPTVQVFLEWLVALPVAGEYVKTFLADENSNTHISNTDFESLVLSAWAVLSLLLMLIGMVLSTLFGPFKPWKLKSKLLQAADDSTPAQ